MDRSVGFVSVCGFVLSMFVVADIPVRVYREMRGYDRAQTPLTAVDLLDLLLEFGVAISASAVFLYIVGSRVEPLKPQAES